MTDDRDSLDAFLESAGLPDPPEDLAARILAVTKDAQAGKQLYWADVEAVARKAMFASAAALLVSVGLAGQLVAPTLEPQAPAVASPVDADDDELDLAQDLERQIAGGFMLLAEER